MKLLKAPPTWTHPKSLQLATHSSFSLGSMSSPSTAGSGIALGFSDMSREIAQWAQRFRQPSLILKLPLAPFEKPWGHLHRPPPSSFLQGERRSRRGWKYVSGSNFSRPKNLTCVPPPWLGGRCAPCWTCCPPSSPFSLRTALTCWACLPHFNLKLCEVPPQNGFMASKQNKSPLAIFSENDHDQPPILGDNIDNILRKTSHSLVQTSLNKIAFNGQSAFLTYPSTLVLVWVQA